MELVYCVLVTTVGWVVVYASSWVLVCRDYGLMEPVISVMVVLGTV